MVMGADIDDNSENELEVLRAENLRLRGLLGIDTRERDLHVNPRSPTLFSEARLRPRLETNSSIDAKIELLRLLFCSRSDVFATRWVSSTTNKTGWSPAVRGGYQSGRANREYLPLTDEVLERHVSGEVTIGVYPLLKDDSCSLLACDFDDGAWALDALAYLDACRSAGIPAALERSRSGDGAHVWILFAEPVPASTARSLGASLLRRAMAARGEIDLSSYDRLFPSQDFMPKGSFGNLIALPLQGSCAERGTTVFLDPTTMQPWPDQWAFLSSLERLEQEDVSRLASELRPVAAGPGSTTAAMSEGGPSLPPVIEAQLGSSLSIARAGLPPHFVAALKHLASLHNPVFYEKQRMRFSTWDTPRFIRCYTEDLEWIHLPRGLVDSVSEFVASQGSTLHTADTRPVTPAMQFNFVGSLRAGQEKVVEELGQHELGVFVAPPGSGKTVIACAVIAKHGVPTLILVDRNPLVEQWMNRLSEFLDVDRSAIGQMGGGKSQLKGAIDVVMIQSLARLDSPAELFAQYGLVIVDECHHLPAVTFETCVRNAPTRKWLGLTATPYRRDGLEGIFVMQCGPIRYEMKADAMDEASQFRRLLFVHQTFVEVPDAIAAPIQDIFKALVANEARTELICQGVSESVWAGRVCLVLTQRTDHIEQIVHRLRELQIETHVLRGGLGKRTLAPVHEAIAARRPGTGIVVVATGSYLGEGFDWPELDTLFLAFPFAFKGRVVQYVGRLLRSVAGKQEVELHDYVDVAIPVLERMYRKRLRAYASLGFEEATR